MNYEPMNENGKEQMPPHHHGHGHGGCGGGHGHGNCQSGKQLFSVLAIVCACIFTLLGVLTIVLIIANFDAMDASSIVTLAIFFMVVFAVIIVAVIKAIARSHGGHHGHPHGGHHGHPHGHSHGGHDGKGGSCCHTGEDKPQE